ESRRLGRAAGTRFAADLSQQALRLFRLGVAHAEEDVVALARPVGAERAADIAGADDGDFHSLSLSLRSFRHARAGGHPVITALSAFMDPRFRGDDSLSHHYLAFFGDGVLDGNAGVTEYHFIVGAARRDHREAVLFRVDHAVEQHRLVDLDHLT